VEGSVAALARDHALMRVARDLLDARA